MEEQPLTEVGTSDQLAALYGALAKAQGEFLPIEKNRSVTIKTKNRNTGEQNGSYQFRYADLEEITAKTRPALAKHGLATMQPIVANGKGGTSLLTRLVHEGGGVIYSEIPLQAGGDDVKNYGALISYMRRYAKSSILDVAADDDLDQNGQGADDDGDEPKQAQRKQSADEGNGYYTDEQFNKSLTGWTAAISKGRSTADNVIKLATSKKKLTDEQIAIIKAIKVTEAQQ